MNDPKPKVLNDTARAKATPTCLTIGMFDGVHLGHQHLIEQSIYCARRTGKRAALLTFHPHPIMVLRKAGPSFLTTRKERLDLLCKLDLDLIVVQPFTPGLARTAGKAFVTQLVDHLGVSELWVGSDFALGYHRSADIPFLQRMGAQRGFNMHVVERVQLDGKAISSSRIRRAVRAGDMQQAAKCLGRLYVLQGPVVVGAQRGRTLGFPTANLKAASGRAIPANGVYAAWATLAADPSGKQRRCVVNIGTRPTFDHGERTIEAHLLDYSRDIYGQALKLAFVARLRPEEHFDSVQALIAQIWQDVAQARKLLKQAPQSLMIALDDG